MVSKKGVIAIICQELLRHDTLCIVKSITFKSMITDKALQELIIHNAQLRKQCLHYLTPYVTELHQIQAERQGS